MTPPSEQDQSESKGMTARRSKRVRLAIPIVLSGTDSSGNEFQESTRTTVVSKHGARIRTTRDLVVGGIVTIENRSLALAANAMVTNVEKRRSSGDLAEIGVELIKAGNVWGIIFPPEDWETGAPLGTAGDELNGAPKPLELTTGAFPSTAPATGSLQPARNVQSPTPSADNLTPPPVEPLPPKAVATAAPLTPRLAPAAPGPPREKIDAITTAVLSSLSKRLDEAVDTRLEAYAEKVTRFTNQFALRVQANFQDAANRTEDQMVVLIQQKLGSLADRVQASRTALESLLARFEALQKKTHTLVEDTEQEIRGASQMAVESARQELTVNLRQGVDGTFADLEGECQARVVAAVSKTVSASLAKADEQLAILMKDRLFKSYAELKWQQEQLIDGVKEQLNQIALSGATNMAAKLESMTGEIVPSAREEMEKSLRESAGKVVARTTQSLQEQAQLLTQDTLVSLQQNVQSLQERMQEESRKVRQSSEQEMIKTADAFSRNIAERSELAIGSVQSAAEQGASKLRAAQTESVRSVRAGIEDFQRQLAARSGLVLEGFQNDLHNRTRELQEGATRLFSQELQSAADELAETSAEKVRQRIQGEAIAAMEILVKESNQRLSAEAEKFFASSSQELQVRLGSHAQTQLDSVIQSASGKFSEHLNKLAQEAGLTLETESRNQLQKVASTLLQSSSETLRKEVEQLTAKLQNDLKAIQPTLADHAKKQLLAMARSTVENLNQEALAGLEGFRTRLRKIGQESHEESLRELEANFREALEKHRATISALLQQQAEQSRDLAGLQIKTISEQIVAKATEALDRQVGKTTRTVTELGEQTRVGLENQSQKIEMEAKNSIWEYQKQMEQSSNASLDKFRKDTGVLLDEVVFRLQQSVRSFQSTTAEDVLAELQKASDNLLEVSAAQMRKQTEQSLNLITDRLKEKEEEVVSDAANVFRARIADIFAILQEGSKRVSELPAPDRVKKQS